MAANLWRFSLILIPGVLVSASASSAAESAPGMVRPNFIIFLCDNLGYGDLGCFGSKAHRTPNVDALAAEGMRLTSFYAASGVCTPSRAALLTGCYPRRVGLHLTQPDGAVLRPVSPNGLHPDEVTIAEVLRGAGYVTACIGKWHLGDQAEFLPQRQGFDEFFGIPYSDDMVENRDRGWPPLPLMRGRRLVRAPADRNLLTRQYTDEAIKFEGRDVWPLLSGQASAKSPHEAFYFYYMDQLQAVRSGRWKLHLPLEAKRTNLVNGTAPAEAELYDLDTDIGETNNVAAAHPDFVQRLTALAAAARTDLGDGARPGKNQRPAGRVARPVPQVFGD